MQVYFEKDAPLAPLGEATIAVLGYGSQGHSQPLQFDTVHI